MDLSLNRTLIDCLEQQEYSVTPWFDESPLLVPQFMRANVKLESIPVEELALVLNNCRDRFQGLHIYRCIAAQVEQAAHSQTRVHVQVVAKAVIDFAARLSPFPHDPQIASATMTLLSTLAFVPDFRASLAKAGVVQFIKKGIQKEILFAVARKAPTEPNLPPFDITLIHSYSSLVHALSQDIAAEALVQHDGLGMIGDFLVMFNSDNIVTRNVFYALEQLARDQNTQRQICDNNHNFVALAMEHIESRISLIQEQGSTDHFSKLGELPQRLSDSSSVDELVSTDRHVDVLHAILRFASTLSHLSQHTAVQFVERGVAKVVHRLLHAFGNHAKIVYHSIFLLLSPLIYTHTDRVTELIGNQFVQLNLVPRLVELLRHYLLRRDEINCIVLCYVLGRATVYHCLVGSILQCQAITLYREVLEVFPRNAGIADAVISALTRASVFVELRPVIQTSNIVPLLTNHHFQMESGVSLKMQLLNEAMIGPMQSAHSPK